MVLTCGGMTACSDRNQNPPDASEAGAQDVAPSRDANPSPDGSPFTDASPEGAEGDDVDVSQADAQDVASRPDQNPDLDASRLDASPEDVEGGWDGMIGSDIGRDDVQADGDAAICRIEAAWTASATGFLLTASGGLPPPPADVGCRGNDVQHRYIANARTLTQTGCVQPRPLARTVDLSDADFSQVDSALARLMTTCETTCGADAPDTILTVYSGSTETRTFQSNFYAGCPGASIPPPYIRFFDLHDFRALLQRIVADACDSPEAGAPEAGTCHPFQPAGSRSP
jgi:hypothetical protein